MENKMIDYTCKKIDEEIEILETLMPLPTAYDKDDAHIKQLLEIVKLQTAVIKQLEWDISYLKTRLYAHLKNR